MLSLLIAIFFVYSDTIPSIVSVTVSDPLLSEKNEPILSFIVTFRYELDTNVTPRLTFGDKPPYSTYEASQYKWIDRTHIRAEFLIPVDIKPDTYTIKISGAVDTLRKSLPFDTNHTFFIDEEAIYLIGLSFYKNKNYDEALNYFNKVIKLNPNHSLAWLYKGLVYIKRDAHEKAFQAFKKAEELDPYLELPHYYLVDFYETRGDFGKALSELEKAINSHKRWMSVSGGFNKKDRIPYKEIIIRYFTAPSEMPGLDDIYCDIGIVLCKKRQLLEGIQKFEQSIKLNPDNFKSHYNLGVAYYELNRYEDAEVEFQKTLALYPRFAPASINLGAVYANTARIERAKEQYESVKDEKYSDIVRHNLAILKAVQGLSLIHI